MRSPVDQRCVAAGRTNDGFREHLTDQDCWFTGFDFSKSNSVCAADPVTYQAAVKFRYD